MTDKEFLERLQLGMNAYVKANIYDADDHEILENFVEWLYKEYGMVYKHGNS